MMHPDLFVITCEYDTYKGPAPTTALLEYGIFLSYEDAAACIDEYMKDEDNVLHECDYMWMIEKYKFCPDTKRYLTDGMIIVSSSDDDKPDD